MTVRRGAMADSRRNERGLVRGLVLLCAVGAATAMTRAQDVRAPAPTLSRPATPTKAADADGFLRRWLLLEPIRTTSSLADSAVRALIGTEHFANQLTMLPRDGERVKAGDAELTWHAIDTALYNVNLYHFAYALAKPTSNVLFWVVTVVETPQGLTGVRLAIGSNAASVWWVNGEEVISLYNDRQSVIDDGVSKRLTLKRGANVIRAAVVNGGGATDFCARFLDANDRPITTITVALPTNR